MVDFHTHSNVSDGDLTPAELINEAVRRGLSAIALTDHDTIEGFEGAREAIKTQKNGKKLHFIPGIEINISWKSKNKSIRIGPGGEFHLIGLGITSPTPGFIEATKRLSHSRNQRNREILNRMYELSIITDIEQAWSELLAIAGGKNGTERQKSGYSLGRPHFASFLIKHKFAKNQNQAFDRYLGVGRPLYVPKDGLLYEEAAVFIRQSGGIPILAHPFSLYLSWGRLSDFIKNLKDMGLAGIEAWHPIARAGSCFRLETLGHSLGLYITEGSDFHGSSHPERRLGYSSKGRKINDNLLEAIPELRQEN